jgi:mono/diheme cytochrome c family protein
LRGLSEQNTIKQMRHPSAFVLGGIAALMIGSLSQAADDKVEKGKYLVEEVSKCQLCHTPRNADGSYDKTKWLKGATLDFSPMHEVEGWHKTAPDLTGASRLFERWQVKGMVDFLMTAKNPRGGKADPPMPDYHMNKEDADAVVAYLKTLP